MQALRFCGLDFGTSNSSLGIMKNDTPCLINLEQDNQTIPSAVFYNTDEDEKNPVLSFGRQAISHYSQGYGGRLMRSFKSLLGTSLIHEKTQIGQKNIPFEDIFSVFIRHLKTHAQTQCGYDLDSVVCGRPVFFVDDNPQADTKAQDFLDMILKKQGFKNVLFQYEPIAAALDYEHHITKEHLVLIIDLGGGTSDFSVVRVSPNRHKQADRKSDILSTQGVHIGGNDFDRILSLHAVMPHLGYETLMRSDFDDKILRVPVSYFHDLATWHKINFLYSDSLMRDIIKIHRASLSPDLLARLMIVLKNHLGHLLALETEKMKINLTANPDTRLDLKFIEKDFFIDFTKSLLNTSLSDYVDRLKVTLDTTIASAQIKACAIDAVFLVGGSTAIPIVRDTLTQAVPNAKIIDGNRFGSIGMGLTIDAKNRFD
jgi:hypothetical chaperone protein